MEVDEQIVRWIDIDNSLPKESQECIVNVESDYWDESCGWDQFYMMYAYFDGEHFRDDDRDTIYDVTHWMAFPEPPKNDGNK